MPEKQEMQVDKSAVNIHEVTHASALAARSSTIQVACLLSQWNSGLCSYSRETQRMMNYCTVVTVPHRAENLKRKICKMSRCLTCPLGLLVMELKVKENRR